MGPDIMVLSDNKTVGHTENLNKDLFCEVVEYLCADPVWLHSSRPYSCEKEKTRKLIHISM